MAVKPNALTTKVVVRPDDVSEISEGGIHLPNQDEHPETGQVVSQGPDVKSNLKGKVVVFNPFDGDNFTHNGVEYLVFDEKTLLAVLE